MVVVVIGQHFSNTSPFNGLPWRFKRRSSDQVGQSYPLSSFLMTLLLLRGEMDYSRVMKRVLKRLVHLWCQNTEDGLQKALLDECPDPTLKSKMHPFTRHSRRRGNNQLRQQLSRNFLARGGGYVSTRHELTLQKLDLVAPRSKLANLASSEFVARQLMLGSDWLQKHFERVEKDPHALKVLNFTLDEARVCQQQVLC